MKFFYNFSSKTQGRSFEEDQVELYTQNDESVASIVVPSCFESVWFIKVGFKWTSQFYDGYLTFFKKLRYLDVGDTFP